MGGIKLRMNGIKRRTQLKVYPYGFYFGNRNFDIVCDLVLRI